MVRSFFDDNLVLFKYPPGQYVIKQFRTRPDIRMQIYAEAESNANELVQFYHISGNIQDIRLRTHDKSSYIGKAKLIHAIAKRM